VNKQVRRENTITNHIPTERVAFINDKYEKRRILNTCRIEIMLTVSIEDACIVAAAAALWHAVYTYMFS